MPIQDFIPDGSLVKEIAGLVKQTARVEEEPRGSYLVTMGDKVEQFGTPLLAQPTTIKVSTLTAIVDAYSAAGTLKTETPIVQVSGPVTVRLIDPTIGDERQQFVYVESTARIPNVQFDRWQDLESFILMLHTHTADSPERSRLLDFVGNLTSGVASDVTDNGASQTVVAKRGITRAGAPVEWDNPVFLTPFRTFVEAGQPPSPFVFRMKQTSNGEEKSVACALFEADGGAWQTQAINNIAEYLRGQLPKEAIVLA